MAVYVFLILKLTQDAILNLQFIEIAVSIFHREFPKKTENIFTRRILFNVES